MSSLDKMSLMVVKFDLDKHQLLTDFNLASDSNDKHEIKCGHAFNNKEAMKGCSTDYEKPSTFPTIL